MTAEVGRIDIRFSSTGQEGTVDVLAVWADLALIVKEKAQAGAERIEMREA